MNYRIRRNIEKISEGILFTSSTITSLAVVLIIVFLFKEGVGLFTSKPMKDRYVFAVHQTNPVLKMSTDQLRKIFNYEITNWAEVGGNDQTISTMTFNDIPNYYTQEEMGSGYENLSAIIRNFVLNHEGAIAFVPEKYIDEEFEGHIIPMENVSLREFLSGREWYPTGEPLPTFGALPLILGTLLVTLGAMLIAIPTGLATAIYLAEISPPKLRNVLKPMVDLLAGIPSVVFGFFGLVVIVPLIKDIFNLEVGETALAGSIILGIMALPTIITISEESLRKTPESLKEASYAIGASRWQTISRISIPYARSGIITAVILGMGRAIGETMAVLMITGNAGTIPHSFLVPVRTIPATIAAEMGESPYGGLHFKALFALGIILFLITLTINLTIVFIRSKEKKLI